MGVLGTKTNKIIERSEFLKNAGMDPSEASAWSNKWSMLKSRVRNLPCYNGVDVLLSFEQYINLASQAGITRVNQIGATKGKFQLGRLGDKGNYEIGNCRFITKEQNYKEWIENGGCATMAITKTTHSKLTHKHILAQSDKVSLDFLLVSPEGSLYAGRNLTEFCKLNGLSAQMMYRVCSGKVKSHRGWTGSYH